MKFAQAAAFPVLLLCSQGVAVAVPVPNVNITWDDHAKFGKYHTYMWVPRGMPAGVKAADYERIRASIDRYLASRGFHKAAAADFAVAFEAIGARETDYQGSYQPGWGSRAKLSIDIYDVQTKQPIWNGVKRAQISAPVSQQELDKAVGELLNRFPPSRGCSHSARQTIIHPCPRDY